MLNKEVFNKLAPFTFFSLFLIPLVKAAAFGGVFDNLGSAMSQFINIIGQLFYPIVSGSLFMSAYGIVYAKLIIGGMLYLLVLTGLKTADKFEGNHTKIISFLIVLLGMIALPQDLTMWLVTTVLAFLLITIIIALGAFAFIFLQGETRTIYFLKAAVFFVMALMFGFLATRLETFGWGIF